MKGIITIELNDETVREAIQDYFTKRVFDASQIARVLSVTPKGGYGVQSETVFSYVVQVDSRPQPEGQ